MTKTNNYLIATAVASALFVAMPMLSNAQTLMDTNAAVDVGVTVDSGPRTNPTGVRAALQQKLEKAKNGYENNLQNAEDNANYRNNMMKASTTVDVRARLMSSTTLQTRNMMGSSTHPMPPGFEDRNDKREASTTLRAKIMEDHREWKEARRDLFEQMKKRVIAQITQALDNLKQVRGRINARIEKVEKDGRDMTEPKALLVTADAKIVLADAAVAALKAYVPVTASSTTSAQASTTVDLERPRALGAAAIKAVNEAKRALNEVIVSIAKHMGLKVGVDGKIEATTTIR